MAPSGDVIALGKKLEAETTRLRGSLPTGLKLVEVASMPARSGVRSTTSSRPSPRRLASCWCQLDQSGFSHRNGGGDFDPLVLRRHALHVPVPHRSAQGIARHADPGARLLVDDAIIAVETMAVKLEQGFDRLHAAAFAYTSTAFPMLTGTLVTVSGFLPIALAKSRPRVHAFYFRSVGDCAPAVLVGCGRRDPSLGIHILSEHRRAVRSVSPRCGADCEFDAD